MTILKGLNLALSFALEIAMLAAFGYVGYHYGKDDFARWVLAIGLPLIAIAVWGIWFAPNSKWRLSFYPGLLISLGLFLLAALALGTTGQIALALSLAATTLVNRVLALIWKQW